MGEERADRGLEKGASPPRSLLKGALQKVAEDRNELQAGALGGPLLLGGIGGEPTA